MNPSRKGEKALLFLGLGLFALGLGLAPSFAFSEKEASPEEVAKAYARALFARDFAEAYRFISQGDQALKSKEEYLQENLPYTGPAQTVARKLSQYMEFEKVQIQGEGASRRVTLKGRIPDTLDPVLQEFLDEDREVKDVAAETKERLERIEALRRTGKFPTREAEGEFQLVREGSGWKVSLGWEEAVLVRLGGEVKMGLPWDFYPLRTTVRAKPGETLQVLFKAKNRSGQEVTAKARHLIEPESAKKHLTSIQCFCFIQRTLKGGEEEEMPYVFRVNWDAPEGLKEITVRYEWYPIEHFKKEWEKSP